MSADSAPLRDWGIMRFAALDRQELERLALFVGLANPERAKTQRQLAIAVFMEALDFGTFTIEDFW